FYHSSLAPTHELGGCWPPTGICPLNPPEVPLLNTSVLLASAYHSLTEGNRKHVLQALFITIALGIYFTLLQASEYYEAPFTISDRVYGSTFFIATGFHGLHVIIGSTFLIICFLRLSTYHFTTANISIPLNILTIMSRRHNIIAIPHGNPNDPKFTLHFSQNNTNHPVSVRSLQGHTQIILTSNSIKHIWHRLPSQSHLLKESPTPKKTIYHYTNHITNIFNHNIYSHRTNFILHYIRGYTSSYTHYHHSMSRATPTSSSISPISKTWRLLHTANYSNTQPADRMHSISLSYAFPMRNNHNQFNLHQTDLKSLITYSSISHIELYRSHCFNNRPRPHIIYATLPSKLKSRARANIVITALYYLYILITTQCGKYTHHINNITPSFTRENALIALHVLSLLLLSLNPKIILGPLYCKYRTKKLVQLQVRVTNLFSSFTLVTLLILTIPIIVTNTDLYKSNKYSSYVKNTVSCAFITSLIPRIIFVHAGQDIFFKYLLLFLITMLILVTANNLFQLFTGTRTSCSWKISPIWTSPLNPLSNRRPYSCISLLHSSTIVVAGIFLLIRFYPLTENNELIQTITLCLGALTTLFTAICLIMVTIGINQPYLVSIIHSLNDEQDIRKIGGLFKALPFTTTAPIIGSLALTGMPFLTGFYSRDLIIETANTARIIFFALLGQPPFSPLTSINENNPLLINSIKRLLIGSVFARFIISSNISPTKVPLKTMPLYLKLTALTVTILGFVLALEINLNTQKLKFIYPSNTLKFSSLLGYCPHYHAPFTSLPRPINKPKISILSLRLNLTKKDFTKNHIPYPIKALHASLKPKRPYQTIFPINTNEQHLKITPTNKNHQQYLFNSTNPNRLVLSNTLHTRYNNCPLISNTQLPRRGFSIDKATLPRFFAFHFILPFIITALAAVHPLFLHETGSNNPTGILSNIDKIPFHPYYTIKDILGSLLLILASLILVLFSPNLLVVSPTTIPQQTHSTHHHTLNQSDIFYLHMQFYEQSLTN
ncbi:hypothetical protein E2I00_010889, partial [Balaenoptera physalus]